MCGRATLSAPPEDLRELFGLDEAPALAPRFNIAPTQPIAIVRATLPRRIELVRWGLIPPWAHDLREGAKLVNVRAETVAKRFGDAFRSGRCLIAVDGFYEWQTRGTIRQPYFVTRRDKKPFALAGLAGRWVSRESGESFESAAVVTVASQAPLDQIHDRMPLVLAASEHEQWLRGEAADAAALLPRPAASIEELVFHPVSTRVNSPANDDAACIAPPEQGLLFG